jgi:solute carrier family 40 (iron-regulated transporter), member 1
MVGPSAVILDPEPGHPAPTDETPLLDVENQPSTRLTRSLYVSHFLSTCNARIFEFGAVLFLADLFSGTLLPASVYALVRAASAILLSPTVGHYVDTGNRLQIVRLSIGTWFSLERKMAMKANNLFLFRNLVGQRLAVASSCSVFWILSMMQRSIAPGTTSSLLGVLAILACIEKLCFIMNTVSVERDWVRSRVISGWLVQTSRN